MAAKKSKSKAWYTIIAPEIFGSKEIGKTTASDPDFLKDRIINLSAVEVSNNFSKYYLKFSFRVTKLNGDKAYTDFSGSECMRDYIARMVLRHVRRIDTVQDLKTKDGVKIRVKGLAVISRKAKSNTLKAIRRRIEELVKKNVEDSSLDDFVNRILDDKMKMYILGEIGSIYPVRNFEFRKTEVIQ